MVLSSLCGCQPAFCEKWGQQKAGPTASLHTPQDGTGHEIVFQAGTGRPTGLSQMLKKTEMSGLVNPGPLVVCGHLLVRQ